MVQTFFETYDTYRDSVYYDASAWSVANFYNINYTPVSKVPRGTSLETLEGLIELKPLQKSKYAYTVNGQDYNIPSLLYDLQEQQVTVAAAFKPFGTNDKGTFSYGSLVIPVTPQKMNADQLYEILVKAQKKHQIQIHQLDTGYSITGVDLGSGYIKSLKKPKALTFIGNGIRSYEAGEVWHLLDTRVHMPITKVRKEYFNRLDLDSYNSLVLVSGNYDWDEKTVDKIKTWVSKGNTIIAQGTATSALIKHKIISEQLLEKSKDSLKKAVQKPYVDAPENMGRERLGGVFINGILDLSHPLGFGYTSNEVVLYKNNLVWLQPSKSDYGTPVVYADKPHVDGYISKTIRKDKLPKAAPVVVSRLGKGRVILFAENPNFRGTAYGTNRMFLNALFLGNHISVPNP